MGCAYMQDVVMSLVPAISTLVFADYYFMMSTPHLPSAFALFSRILVLSVNPSNISSNPADRTTVFALVRSEEKDPVIEAEFRIRSLRGILRHDMVSSPSQANRFFYHSH
jgi:hypothetical protein